MKLHWGPVSPFVRKVMITAHETGLVGRITLIRSPVAMNKANADVMVDNPLSKIPTLVTDEGVAMFDSDVICEFLDSMHEGPKLIPQEGDRKWQVLRWNALGSGMLDALVLWRNERMRPEGHRSVGTLLAYEQKCRATVDWVEREIDAYEQTSFSLGHIAIGCMFGYLDLRFPDVDWRTGRPSCERWFAGFKERRSTQQTEASIAESLVPSSDGTRNAVHQASIK